MVLFSRPSEWLYLNGACSELGHTWHPSCVYSSSEIFFFTFVEAIKIYLPLYLVSNASRWRDLRWLIYHVLPNVVRSSFFLAVNGSGFVAFLCLVRRVVGRFYFYSAGLLPAFIASVFAILCERKSRRGLLTGYVSTLAAEVLFSLLQSRGVVRALPYGEVAIFSFASAVLLHRQWTNRGPQRDAVSTVLGGLFHPYLPLAINRNTLTGSIADMVLVGVWSFACGYLVQTALSILTRWKKIINRKYKLQDLILNKYGIQFGTFLAFLTTGFKLSNGVLSLLPIPRDLRLLLAGLLGGLSMVFLRSPTISLYVAWKALEVLYFKAARRGYVKAWYYGDALLYAVSTAIVFHAMCFEAHHVREAYWKFIIRLTRGRLLFIDYKSMDYFGTHASKGPTQRQQRQSDST